MRNLLAVVAGACVAGGSICGPAVYASQPQMVDGAAIVLRDVHLGQLSSGSAAGAAGDVVTIVLHHGHIAQLCHKEDACAIPADARDAMLNGKYVVPALTTAHAHLALLNGKGEFDAAQYTRANVLDELKQFQRYGVTTVVSLGMNRDLVWDVRDEQRAGHMGGARLLTVGRGIGVPGGFPPFAAAADQLDRPATPEQARAAVDRAAAHHADLIKMWVDSNHGKLPEIGDNIARAVIAEAHAKGMRVAAHVYALEDARRVVREGVDILAHSVRDKPVDSAFVDLLKSKGTWYLPTLTVDESFFAYADHPDLLNDPMLAAALPPSQLALMKSEAYCQKILTDPATQQHRQDFATAMANLKTLWDAGVKIGFGTDAGASLGRIPGYSEHRELQLMVRAGLTPAQAVACATSHNADLLRLPLGRIRQGATADLLVLDSDPAKDVAALNHILAVYQDGVRVAP